MEEREDLRGATERVGCSLYWSVIHHFCKASWAGSGRCGARRHAVALPRWLAARVDSGDHIEGLIGTDDYVVAAGIDGVTGFDRDPSITAAADDLQSADNASSYEVTVVQPVLRKQVSLLIVQVGPPRAADRRRNGCG